MAMVIIDYRSTKLLALSGYHDYLRLYYDEFISLTDLRGWEELDGNKNRHGNGNEHGTVRYPQGLRN